MPANSIGRASAAGDQEQNLASLADHDPANPASSSDARDATTFDATSSDGEDTRKRRGITDEATRKRRTMPVKMLRDYWAGEEARAEWPSSASNRIAAGRVVELAVREARRLIEERVAERADPLPGE
jgi:hypothetical protein